MPKRKLHKVTLKEVIALYKKRKLAHPVACAKSMCYAANQDPHKIFMLGIKASRVEKKTKLTKRDGSNVIDFLEHLKKKRDEEQRANFEEEIQDPF